MTERATRPRRWPIGRSLLLFAAGWLGFTWPWLAGRVTIPWDAKAHFYPQLVFLAHALHGGESPFWTPNVFSGHPQVADPQSLIFTLPFLLLALLRPEPSFAAADAVTFAMLGAGGVAVIFGFRARGWHWAGAVAAALVFCFGASAAWRVQHVGQVLSLGWTAIAFVLLEAALRRRSVALGIAAGIAAAALLIGRDQVAVLGAYLLAARVVGHWLAGPRRADGLRRSFKPLLAAGLTALALVAVPVLLSTLFGAESNRPVIDLEGAGRGSLHPAHLLTLFAADLFGSSGPQAEVWGPPSFAWSWTGLSLAQNMFVLYVGAIPTLLLLVFGLGRGVLLDREIRGFTAAAAVLLLYALGWYTPFFALAYDVLPGIRLFRRPADATFLLGATFGVLAGYLVHRFATGALAPAPPRRRWLEALLVVLPLLAAAVLAAQFGRLASKALVPLLTATALFALAAAALAFAGRLRVERPNLAALLVIGLVFLDLGWNNGPTPSTALPPAEYAALRPGSADPVIAALREQVENGRSDTRRDRVELVGLGFAWPNASLVHDLEHTLGYNPLRLGTYAAATGAIDTIALPDQRRFPPLFPSYRSRLADLLGLRFIVTPEPIETIDAKLAANPLPLIGRPGGRYLYENPGALPRVALATRAVAADPGVLVATGRWPDLDPRTAVTLERVPDGFAGSDEAGTARLVAVRNTVVVVEAQAPAGGGFVVLRDPWHPWWFADVDGEPAEILRADVLFRAVRVPEGQSRVRFVFRPFTGAFDQVWERWTGGSR